MFSRNNGTKDEDDDTIGSLFSRQCRSHYHPADQKAVRKRRGAEEKDAEAGTPEEFMVGHAVGAINIPTCSKLDQDRRSERTSGQLPGEYAGFGGGRAAHVQSLPPDPQGVGSKMVLSPPKLFHQMLQ
nr:hypothetical protein Iba_chr12bCG13920 [Ipomoea batatas]